MYKRLILLLTLAFFSVATFAQESTHGGVKAKVVNRANRAEAVENAKLSIYKGGDLVKEALSAADGSFLFDNLENGDYTLKVEALDFVSAEVNVSVEGFVRDLMFVSLVAQQILDIDDSNFAEFDMDDSGYTDVPSILYSSNDVFSNIAGYKFSAVRYKNRGYSSESQEVLLSGIKMNDAVTGYSPYSLWSGLNEALRSKETTSGSEASDRGVGGYNGLTNFIATPSSVRTGWRFSVLSNSALYRLRLMGTYASGELENGWSYAFNVSARVGGNDWVDGLFYRSFAYYAGVEKKFGDIHKLSLVAFATPGNRGAQNGSTQEVYDLTGNNMYNSNWGYQDGKVRNARVRKTHEPVFILKYTANPLENLEATATVLYRTGKNGYTALDWYDAPDPRPDYYRNLPSYFYNENSDYGKDDRMKAAWAEEAWRYNLNGTQQLNWDRMYDVNAKNLGEDGLNRSKYAVEERRVDQNDINVALATKWRAEDWFTLNGGANFKWNRTENYKKMDDLLGGDYYVNIDQFAERDFATQPEFIQNDLDYYLENGAPQTIYKGDKYGYDYYAHVRNANIWANGVFEYGALRANAALEIGYATFWREGLTRKGLFAGLDDNGNDIIVNGNNLTQYDDYGKVISSKGDSDKPEFLTYSAKIGASYFFTGGHTIGMNAGYHNDAPTFSQSFVSPRTRNTIMPNLTTTKAVAADLSYAFKKNGYDIKITGFYTKIMDQTDMMSLYDDSQNSFVNYAVSGIDQRHLGFDLGFQVPLVVTGLYLQGVLSMGEYIYTSTPRMIVTIDNSNKQVQDVPVSFWKSHPIYKKEIVDGKAVYPKDDLGNFTFETEGEQKHYVPSTPQLAASLGLNYRTTSYWFFNLDANYFDRAYLDMNPSNRTDFAVAGPDMTITPGEIEYMTEQEKFAPSCLLNASVGKSWYINRIYNFGFSLEVKNILNNRNVMTGGYEQSRTIDSKTNERYYNFDSKYFYMSGINYMVNLYFRF